MNMPVRRVYVIWTHRLFLEAVRRLLASPEVEWVGASADHQVAYQQILRLQPDTVLIEEPVDEDAPPTKRRPGHQAADSTSREVLQILETTPPGIRVMRLSLAENELNVYQRETHTLGTAGELLQLIREQAGGREALP
jgi:DNA-binding NarL/FixJ family response regulator